MGLTIKELLAKAAKGEALSDEDKAFAAAYDPQKELDAASAAARRKAEAEAKKALDDLARANEEIASLREQADPERAKTETAKLMARIEKLEAAKAAAEKAATEMKRTATVRDLAKAAGIVPAKGIDPKALDLLVDNLMRDVDVADADAVREAFDGFRAANAGLIAAATVGGAGQKGDPGVNLPPAGNPWRKESLNLTEQMRLVKDNPNEAAKLAAEAGVKLDLAPANPVLG